MLPLGIYLTVQKLNLNNSDTDISTQGSLISDTYKPIVASSQASTATVQTNTQSSSEQDVVSAPKPTTATAQTSTVPRNTTPAQPYRAPVCTDTIVPFETSYKEASDFLPSQSYTGLEGRNGKRTICTPDSTGYKPPDSTLISGTRSVWIGTRTNRTVQTNYEQAYQAARSECIPVANKYGYDSAGDVLCIEAITAKLTGI